VKEKLLEEQKGTSKCLKEKDNWCSDCNTGFTSKKIKQHEDHSRFPLVEENLNNPSVFLTPEENNKTNAVCLIY